MIDFVGPIAPTSERGHRFVFTCVCAWSGCYLAFPTKDSTAETAARYLFHYVIMDLAGYPVCIGSDAGAAFVSGVVQDLLRLFDISRIIGSAYHLQAQGGVERPHREYNKVCKLFMEAYENWDLVCSIFVWSVRTSIKLYNAMYTPYEIITGLKPRSPIDAVLSMNVVPESVSYDKYITELDTYLKTVHQYADEQHERIRNDEAKAKLRQFGPGQCLSVGEYCLVRCPLTPGISKRLQRKNRDEIYQVVETHGDGVEAKAYTVCDLRGRRDDSGFSQPVVAEL
jgi:hypothetical protein